jgi:hypothetical protein
MRTIALTMLLALWTHTCWAGERYSKSCEQHADGEIPSRFLVAVAHQEPSPSCIVGFITPSYFYGPSCYKSQSTIANVAKIYQCVQLSAGWLTNCFL